MSELIILAGFTGNGKTTIAKQYKDRAIYLSGDEIHYDAARRAFPYIRKKYIYNWQAWPRNPETMHLELLLFTTIQSIAPKLRNHSGHLLIEGTMLGNSWFREALISALGAHGCKFKAENIHLLYLRLADELVYANVQARLTATSGREDERTKLTSLEKVAKNLQSYEKVVSGSPWLFLRTTEAVHQKIQQILSAGQEIVDKLD